MSPKHYSNSKLMWLGNGIIAVGGIQALGPYAQYFLPLTAEWAWGLVTILLGIAVKIARAFTFGPVDLGETLNKLTKQDLD